MKSIELITTIERSCILFSALATLLGASLGLQNAYQSKEKKDHAREIYGHIWASIKNTGVLMLPEMAVEKFVSLESVLHDWVRNIIDKSIIFQFFVIILSPLLAAVAGWYISGWKLAFLISFLLITPILLFLGQFLMEKIFDTVDYTFLALGILSIFPLMGLLLFVGFTTLKAIFEFDVFIAYLITIFGFPIYASLFLFPTTVMGIREYEDPGPDDDLYEYTSEFERIHHKLEMRWPTVGIAMSLSFPITFISILLGSIFCAECWIPKTIQMFSANVIFDIITVLATFKILKKALTISKWYSLPVAIFIDIIVAACAACSSLYLGVAFSDNHLSILQVLRVFIGLSPNEGSILLGPYFWAMHTTFIPTLIYLLMIVVFLIAKLIVLPIASLTKKASEQSEDIGPHALTGLTFAVIAGALGLVSILLQIIKDILW